MGVDRSAATARPASGSGDAFARVLYTSESSSATKALRLRLQAQTSGHFVCLHEADDIKRLLTQLRPDRQGRPTQMEGPLRALLKEGGVLFIDYQGFTQPEAESLNELFARVPTYGGVPVHPNVRIVGAVSQDSIAKSRWSPAFMSRFHRVLQAPTGQAAEDPADAIAIASAAQLSRAHVLDLHSVSPWRQLLGEHVRLDAQGNLQWAAAPLDALLQRGATVVLRNAPPGDAHLLDFLRLRAQGGGAARLQMFHGYTAEELAARSARHLLVARPERGQLHVATAHNFPELFEQTVIRADGKVATAPGKLAALDGKVLHIATPLTEAQWDALLNHASPLALSVDAAAEPPAHLAERLPVAAAGPAPTEVSLQSWQPKPGSAQVLTTPDADAAVAALAERLPNVLVVDAHADLQADELLQALRLERGRYAFGERPAAAHLARGGVLVVRGLAPGMALPQALAPALLTPTGPGAWVILQEPSADPVLAQMADPCVDAADAAQRAAAIAAQLGQPGLDAGAVRSLQAFAQAAPQPAAGGPRGFGLAFMRKLAGYHRAVARDAALAAWGHSLADLLRHEYGDDQGRIEALNQRAAAAFGPRPDLALDAAEDRPDQCMRLLREHRALFLQGPPGAGKTYGAQSVARGLGVAPERVHTLSVGTTTTRADLLGRDVPRGDSIQFEDGPVAAWARDARPGIKLLVVDEANLPRPGFWSFLRGAFDARPALLIDGAPVPLTDEHKIIFTGNADSLVGRHVHPEVRDCFITQHFAAYSPAYLLEYVALPTLCRLMPQLSQARANEVATQALALHVALASLPEGRALSPRNLEEALARGARALSQNGPALPVAMAQAYAGLLSAEGRQGLALWQALAGGAPMPVAAAAPGPSTQGITWTHSTSALAQAVDAFLDTRAWRAQHGHRAVGQVGLLVQGPSGRGKDEVVAQRLEARGLPYTVLNVGMDYASFSEAIQAARAQGTVVVLSEMNLLPAGVLEGRLNDVLSGPNTHPGFAAIATINPPTFSGRAPLSDALLNRFVVHRVDDYDAGEVEEIVRDRLHMLRSPADMAQLAAAHNALMRELQQAQSLYVPTARELVRGAERLADDPSLSVTEVIEELYALQRSLPRPQRAAAASSEVDATLTTLANLIAPGAPWRVVRAPYAGARGRTHERTITVDAAATPRMQQAQALWQLLRTEPAFEPPMGPDLAQVLQAQLAAAARRYPALAAEFEQMAARLRMGSAVAGQAADGAARDLTDGEAMPAEQGGWLQRGLSWFTGAASATPTMGGAAPGLFGDAGLLGAGWWRPGAGGSASGLGSSVRGGSRWGQTSLDNPSFASGLGEGARPLHVRWEGSIAGGVAYMVQQSLDTFQRDGTMRATIPASLSQAPAEGAEVLGRVTLSQAFIDFEGGRSVVELYAPSGQQPTHVQMYDPYNAEDFPAPPPRRTPAGRWVVDSPGPSEVDDFVVTYALVAAAGDDVAPVRAASSKPLPFVVDYCLWPELAQLVSELDREQPEGALRELERFFNTHVVYSLSPEVRALYDSNQRLPLVNQLLALRTGCCFETAHAFVAIARDLFGGALPVRLNGGVVSGQRGGAGGHAWAEAHLPGKGWTIFDPTGRSLDEATRAGLGLDDLTPLYVLGPVDVTALPPLRQLPPVVQGVSTLKRSAVAAEIAPGFRQALRRAHGELLFDTTLDVRESHARLPGRLDVERLVRGEVEPFSAQAVGRQSEPRTVLLPADHTALLANGQSAHHETLRALLELQVPVQVFTSRGDLIPVRSLAEALAVYESAPQNIGLAIRHAQMLAHYAGEARGRVPTALTAEASEALFTAAARSWMRLAETAKSLPSFVPVNGIVGCEDPTRPRYYETLDPHQVYATGLHLDIGSHGKASAAQIDAMLLPRAYVSRLLVETHPAAGDLGTLRLPAMPNLRTLEFENGSGCSLLLPYHQGPLTVHGKSTGRAKITIYATRPELVVVDFSMRPYVTVLPAAQAPSLPQGEQTVDEPLEFLCRYSMAPVSA